MEDGAEAGELTIESSHVVLTADIDYAGGAFVGIDSFTGVFDGDGYTISNMIYEPTATASTLGFIRNLVGGTVTDLGIDGVTGTSTDQNVAGLVVTANNGAVIDGNRVTGVELTTTNQYAAGLVYQTVDGVDVMNNYVEATLSADRYPAAISGYARYDVDIENNVAIADITTTGTLSRAGMMVGYQGNSGSGATRGSVNVLANAAAGGTITWDEEALTDEPDSHRIVGAPHSTGYLTLDDNIASDALTVGGVVPESSNQEGETVPAADFDVVDTYWAIGFDFTTDWAWDAENNVPVPAAFHPEGLLDLEDKPEEPGEPVEEELAIEGLEGSGTSEAPFLIGTADDLETFTSALNINEEALSSARAKLTADIDYEGGVHPGINTFSGTFDGAGYMISNITYGPGNGSEDLGFIRTLRGGTLRNLTIDGLNVAVENDARVAGLVVYGRDGAVVDGNAVTNADLSTNNQYVAGLVNNLENGEVTNNWVHGNFTSDRYGSAAVGYGRDESLIENNLVDATLVTTGNRAHGGLLLGFMGANGTNPVSTLHNNVVIDGVVDWLDGTTAAQSSTVLGMFANGGWIVENNLVNETILVGGSTVSGSGDNGEHGTPTTVDALAELATYEELGWNFERDWEWSDELNHPVPSGATIPDELDDPDLGSDTELEGIEGEGTEESPYLIASAANLDTVAAAINENPLGFNTGYYQLATNIDYEGGTFVGIDQFRGVLDGNGYKIYNISYGASETSDERALIRILDGGTVKDLTIDGVITHISQASQISALVSVASNGAVLDGNTIINADLSTGAQYVAGIAANAQNGVSVTNNWVEGTFRSARYPAAVVGYSRHDVLIENNLVNADVSSRGARAHGGMIVSYFGGYDSSQPMGTVTGNVIYDGRVHWTGGGSSVLAGRILGQTANGGWVVENNLANENVRVGNSTPDAPGEDNRHGTDTSPEALADQQTYLDLGWDFENSWTWDAERGHPVPNRSFLFGSGTETQPFTIDTAADLEFLAELINSGDESLLGGQYIAFTADLDFAGREPFEGIDRFDGVIDGRNHMISNMTLAPSESSNELAFVRDFTGSATNISFTGLTADSGDTTNAAAGFALRATDADIRSISITDSTITAPNADAAAGLVAYAAGTTVIDQNSVDVDVTAKANPAGVVAVLSDDATITRNLVTADVTVIDEGEGTVGGGLVAALPSDNATVTGNVVLGTDIGYTGEIDGHAGRVIGYTGHDGWSADDNLAYVGITIAGDTVTGPGVKNQHGTDADESVLSDKATYEALGWDFMDHWRWDTELNRPVVKYVLPEELPTRITATFYGDTETQCGFTWYQAGVENPDGAAVRISTDPAFPDDTTRVITGEHRAATHGETVFQAVATDLEPGTTYYYMVGDSQSEIWSETGTFVTADGESDFTFIDLTDTQAKGTAEAEMSAHTMREAIKTVPEAEFMVHNGDVVQDSHVEQDWIDLFGAAQNSLQATTIVPASGNHDLHPRTFVDHFKVEHPNDQDTETGAYYSYTYNNAHFIVLNTNDDVEKAVSDEQVAWMKQDAEAARANGAEWVILVMHKGLYTAGNHADDAEIIAMREQLVPVIDELEIDLVLQGHDHYYSRTKVLTYDAEGAQLAKPVETTTFTEVVNGKRYEYALNPDGSIYYMPNTAGAKHYNQQGETAEFLIETFLQLFERLGTPRHGRVQTFTGINVTDDRLTVEVYHISGSGQPVLAEGFGIDRGTEEAVALLDALPNAEDVTLDHEEQILAARAVVDAMSSQQREMLPNLDRLIAAERALRELQGLVVTDGSEIAWFAEDAQRRQALTVRNESNKDFENAPVRLEIENTPDVERDQLTFVTEDGTVLSHEVESWNPGSSSIVWVKLPLIEAEAVTSLWAYYGGTGQGENPADVWGSYALVDHMMEPLASGETRTDSTGRHEGTLLGGDLTVSTGDDGRVETRFAGSSLEYPGTIGSGYSQLAVSTMHSFTEEDIAQTGPNGGAVVGKQRPTDSADPAFAQVIAVDGSLQSRYNSNSHTVEIPADGEPHLVTQTYDGMTLAIFVDGVQQVESMVERKATNGDTSVKLTIGDLYTEDGSPYAPFYGEIDEVQIAGFPFLPEYEKFRCANYFGDAVAYGDIASQGDIALTLGSPGNGTEIEAGIVPVSGTLSERAEITAVIGGETVFSETVDAGKFTIDVPVNPAGEQTVTFTAQAGEATSQEQTLDLVVSDTTAPNQPIVSDNSATVYGDDADVELSATPDTDDLEKVTAQFFANEADPVDGVTVRTGSTTDRTPDAITPTSGEVSEDGLPVTVGDNANPYQIYEIPVEAGEGEYHLTWSGTGDDRTVSAWVYDHEARSWILKDEASDENGEAVSLDVTALESENAVADGHVILLVWRGMTALPWGDDYVYEQYPDAADFDWAFNHVPDTQLYAEATPWMMNDMFSYIVNDAEERKTELIIQAGDWVNREYLFDEYQWRTVDPSAQMMEEAGIPFMISWGNHDYSEDRNGRVMLEKWFPMERFEASTEGSAFDFGGSYDIDNFYYTSEIEGSKLLILSLGYWSSNTDDDPGIAWAQEVLEAHPDHQVILLSHDYLVARTPNNPYSNPRINELLVDKYPNIRLVLTGHNSGSYVTSRQADHGSRSYGILTDYQTRPWGGHEFFKNISVDAENGLLYVNTYSPWLDEWISDGRWHSPISEAEVPGFHGDDSENFVLEIDLGFNTTRTIEAQSLTLASGEPTAVGDPIELTGAEETTAVLDGVDQDREYEWYAELTDQSGHVTRSETLRFTIGEEPEEPVVPHADTYEPSYSNIEVTAGETGSSDVTFEPALEDGINPTFEIDTVPAGWEATVSESGTVEVTVPVDAQESHSGLTVTVNYGDESSDTATVNVAVTAAEVPERPELPTGNSFLLSNDWSASEYGIAFAFGRNGDQLLVGDWDGDNVDSLGVRRGATVYLKNELAGGNAEISFTYGRADDEVIVGDWDGNGIDTLAVRRGDQFLMKNELAGGNADLSFNYGRASDTALAGDWDGNGKDSIAVRRGDEFLVKNELAGGNADLSFNYGRASDVAFAGDFDADGIDTFGVHRGDEFLINNALAGGAADLVLTYGEAGDAVLVGDWNGDGVDTPGVNRIIR